MNAFPDNAGILAQLPSDLHYLIEPVLKVGCRTEWDAFDYLDKATDQQMAQLADIAERVLKNDHYPLVTRFLRMYEITAFDECAQLYFFFGVLDHGDLKFDRVPGSE